MRNLLRKAALLTALLTLLFCACAKKPGGDPADPTASPEGPAIKDDERVKTLAAAFRLYGEVEKTAGIPLNDIERFVYCMYTSSLDECELKGYGRIEGAKADEMLKAVFGVDPGGILRAEYDPAKQQEYFYLNNYYYVLRSENAGTEYRVLSSEDLIDAKEQVRGVAVTVGVFENGELESEIYLELLFCENEEWLTIQKCEIRLTK